MHLEYLNFSHTLPSYLDYSEIRKRKCLKKFLFIFYILLNFFALFLVQFLLSKHILDITFVYTISFYHFKTKFLTLSLKIINFKAN